MASLRARTRVFVPVVVAAILLLIVLGCIRQAARTPVPPRPSLPGAPAPSATLTCNSNGVVPNLNCPGLPNTSAAGVWVDAQGNVLGSQQNGQGNPNAYLDYDLWAWNSFVAMNWPALDPATNNNQRGFYDPNQSFAGAQSTDTAVWETYKEKREVFLYDYVNNKPSTEIPQPWNSAPQYGPSNSQVPCCPGSTCNLSLQREIGSQSKLFLDTLDETAEVASEARETQTALCGGWVSDPVTQCPTSSNPCCKLPGNPVGPRVWRGNPYPSPMAATPVVYEVKINYDSFAYIVDTYNYYNVTAARAAASRGAIQLPARTSAAAMPPKAKSHGGGPAGPNSGPAGYSSSKCLGMQGSTPCAAGAVHLKAAWIPLTAGVDDFSRYHTARAYQYVSNTNVTGGVCKTPGTFGLIGLHIIQRIHENVPANNPPLGGQTSSGQPRGGTYVFATWEHVDNDLPGRYTYANYASSTPTPVPYPNVLQAPALPLQRVYPPLPSTMRANSLIHTMLGCPSSGSVWCNYQLIGTQYTATNTPTNPAPLQLSALTPQPTNIEAPANSGQPYYLANLVVESNVGLQQFQGLPPNDPADQSVITVIPNYSGQNPNNQFTTAYQRNAQNVASRTHKDTSHQFDMGGCMGCHGVAQLTGYSFSFVLLDNQYGAIPDTQTTFTIPPTPDPPSQ